MEQFKLVIAEKSSVAQALAAVLGAKAKKDGYLEGNGWLVSWCIGHLVELAQPEAYDEKYAKWNYNDLPILPAIWKYEVSKDKKKQFATLRGLMNDKRVSAVVCATDAGREGELIFRLVYQQARMQKTDSPGCGLALWRMQPSATDLNTFIPARTMTVFIRRRFAGPGQIGL